MAREKVREFNSLPKTQLGLLSLLRSSYDTVCTLDIALNQTSTHPDHTSLHLLGTGCTSVEAATEKFTDRRNYLHLLVKEYRSKYGIDLQFLVALIDAQTVFQPWDMLLGDESALSVEQRALLRFDTLRS